MQAKRYAAELSLAIGAYVALLLVTITVLRDSALAGGARAAVALLPMLAAPGIVWAVVRQLRRIDEMQRRVQLDSLASAFAGTALLTFGYGFLEGAGFPRLSMFCVWPLMAALWLVSAALIQRRYL